MLCPPPPPLISYNLQLKICRAGPQLVFTFNNRLNSSGLG